jgi:hypothetical protein
MQSSIRRYKASGKTGEEREVKNMFDIRKIKPEESRIFRSWSKHAGITWEDFCEGVEWVRQDPCDGSTGGMIGQLTRELGCDRKRGLVRLDRRYDATKNRTGFLGFYEQEFMPGHPGLHLLWCHGVSISARDRI